MVWLDLFRLNLKEGAPITMFDLEKDIRATGEVSDRFNPATELAWLRGGSVLNPAEL